MEASPTVYVRSIIQGACSILLLAWRPGLADFLDDPRIRILDFPGGSSDVENSLKSLVYTSESFSNRVTDSEDQSSVFGTDLTPSLSVSGDTESFALIPSPSLLVKLNASH